LPRARRWYAAVVSLGLLAAACSPAATTDPTDGTAPTTTSTTAVPPTTTSTRLPPEVEYPDAIAVSVGDDLAAMVEAAEPGSTFLIAAGIHRLQSVRPKDGMTFVGAPGAVMSGAIELSGFVFDGEHWRLDGLERDDRDHGRCATGYEACGLPQDLFLDDAMLHQVTHRGDLAPGRWMWDGNAVILADDPTGRTVELSMIERAFVSAAANVTIRYLVVEKYATLAQSGAIQAQEPGDGPHGFGWLIEHVEVRLNHAAGIRTGEATVVRNVHAHHNGQQGIAVNGGRDVLIEDSVISENNVAGFQWGWEAGGMKAQRIRGLIVRNVVAENNGGPGLWTDIDCVDVVYEGNTVRGNTGPGIFHEISYDAVIRDNVVEGNGFDHAAWLWGAGILVAASANVEVYGNTVRGNHNAITLIQQHRDSGAFGPRLLQNVRVYDNLIVDSGLTGAAQDVGDDSVFTDRDLRFEGNTYVGVDGRAYAWMNRFLDRDQWMRFGHDVDGSWR
jgi:parallel beta-helix repeat protein